MFQFIQTAYAQTQGAAVEVTSDETLFNVVQGMFQVLLNIFIAVLLLFASYLFAKVLSHYIIGKLRDVQGETLHEDVVILVRRMVTVGVIAIGMGIAFQYVLGLDILQLIGFFGLGIGFAFKDMLSNLIAGVIVLMQGRFHIGDFIKIGEYMGKVVEIQTRATILKAIDGTEVIIPNAEFLSKTVISFTTNPSRRVEIAVGVHYNTDLELATEVIEDLMKQNSNILPEPKPKVIAKEFGDSAIILGVRFWVQSRDGVSWITIKSQLVHEIKKAFEQHGITIPFPIRTVHQGTPQDGLGWQQIPQQPAQEAVPAQETQNPPQEAVSPPQAMQDPSVMPEGA